MRLPSASQGARSRSARRIPPRRSLRQFGRGRLAPAVELRSPSVAHSARPLPRSTRSEGSPVVQSASMPQSLPPHGPGCGTVRRYSRRNPNFDCLWGGPGSLTALIAGDDTAPARPPRCSLLAPTGAGVLSFLRRFPPPHPPEASLTPQNPVKTVRDAPGAHRAIFPNFPLDNLPSLHTLCVLAVWCPPWRNTKSP